MLVRTKAKVLDSLSGVLGSPDEESVGTGGGLEGKLVEGEGLATSSKDPSAGRRRKPQGSNGELGDGEGAVIISNSSDNNDDLVGILASVLDDAGERNRGAVDSGHEQAAEHDLVEGRVGSACIPHLLELAHRSFQTRGSTYGPKTCRASRAT